jgi:hypothetical protein
VRQPIVRRSSSIEEEDRIALAYRLTLGRRPEPDEMTEASFFLDHQAHLSPAPTHPSSRAADRAALVDFCHVLLNSNEFLYVD